MGSDEVRLLLLAGFVPEEVETSPLAGRTLGAMDGDINPAGLVPEEVATHMEQEDREWLGRFGRALSKMPPGRERDLWKDNLRRNTELIETFLERLSRESNQT